MCISLPNYHANIIWCIYTCGRNYEMYFAEAWCHNDSLPQCWYILEIAAYEHRIIDVTSWIFKFWRQINCLLFDFDDFWKSTSQNPKWPSIGAFSRECVVVKLIRFHSRYISKCYPLSFLFKKWVIHVHICGQSHFQPRPDMWYNDIIAPPVGTDLTQIYTFDGRRDI